MKLARSSIHIFTTSTDDWGWAREEGGCGNWRRKMWFHESLWHDDIFISPSLPHLPSFLLDSLISSALSDMCQRSLFEISQCSLHPLAVSLSMWNFPKSCGWQREKERMHDLRWLHAIDHATFCCLREKGKKKSFMQKSLALREADAKSRCGVKWCFQMVFVFSRFRDLQSANWINLIPLIGVSPWRFCPARAPPWRK